MRLSHLPTSRVSSVCGPVPVELWRQSPSLVVVVESWERPYTLSVTPHL